MKRTFRTGFLVAGLAAVVLETGCGNEIVSFGCQETTDCPIGKCSTGEDYQRYECSGGVCSLILYESSHPCEEFIERISCDGELECPFGVCLDGSKYTKYFCGADGLCDYVRYVRDPCDEVGNLTDR